MSSKGSIGSFSYPIYGSLRSRIRDNATSFQADADGSIPRFVKGGLMTVPEELARRFIAMGGNVFYGHELTSILPQSDALGKDAGMVLEFSTGDSKRKIQRVERVRAQDVILNIPLKPFRRLDFASLPMSEAGEKVESSANLESGEEKNDCSC
jgi:hypothetical protein